MKRPQPKGLEINTLFLLEAGAFRQGLARVRLIFLMRGYAA
jgi:hypothetical protein